MASKKIYSNLPTINREITRDFFETYFQYDSSVTENEFNAVVAYFENRSDNTLAAGALALAVITTASERGIPVMEILDRFSKLSKQQIDTYLASFINLSRVPSSLLGVSNLPSLNKYVARQILP